MTVSTGVPWAGVHATMDDAELAPLISNPDLAVHHRAQWLGRLTLFVSTCSMMVFSTSVQDDSIMILVDYLLSLCC